MARFRNARGRTGRSGFRPQTFWASAWNLCGSINANAQEADFFDLSALMDPDWAASGETPLTLRRTRGMHEVLVDVSEFQTAQCLDVALGIGVAEPASIAAGVCPRPLTMSGWDGWLWHEWIPLRGGSDVGRVTEFAPPVIDSLAMRRLEDNALFFAIEADTDAGGTQTVYYNAAVRCLFSLSSKQ